MLTDRITLCLPSISSDGASTHLSPEDYLSSSLGVIFPGDITNPHGDPTTPVIYTSPRFGRVFLSLADPVGEDSRRLFAQYLWNAGVYVAVGIEDAMGGVGVSDGSGGEEEKEKDNDCGGRLNSRRSGMGARSTIGDRGARIGGRSETGEEKEEREAVLEKDAWDVRDETVLELGAGTGIAGIVAVKVGAREVFLTDYPAEEVLANLRRNTERNLDATTMERHRCRVQGHQWGMVPGYYGWDPKDSRASSGNEEEMLTGDIDGRLEGIIAQEEIPAGKEGQDEDGQRMGEDTTTRTEGEIRDGKIFPDSHARYFSRIILADCLWMPSQHANLHRSIAYFLSRTGYAIAVASFHTGRAKMAPFFDEEALSAVGLEVESIVERDPVGGERPWRSWELGDEGEGREDLSERKRWLAVGVLKRMGRYRGEAPT